MSADFFDSKSTNKDLDWFKLENELLKSREEILKDAYENSLERIKEAEAEITTLKEQSFDLSNRAIDQAKKLQEEITRLKEENKNMVDILKGYEQFEANILSEDKLWWPNRAKDVFTGELYEEMLELQQQRNKVLELYKETLKT